MMFEIILPDAIEIKFADWVKPNMLKQRKESEYFYAKIMRVGADCSSGIMIGNGNNFLDLYYFADVKILKKS